MVAKNRRISRSGLVAFAKSNHEKYTIIDHETLDPMVNTWSVDQLVKDFQECKKLEQMTLAEHAEAWQREQGKEVPDRDTEAWQTMYEQWVDFAFQGISQ